MTTTREGIEKTLHVKDNTKLDPHVKSDLRIKPKPIWEESSFDSNVSSLLLSPKAAFANQFMLLVCDKHNFFFLSIHNVGINVI